MIDYSFMHGYDCECLSCRLERNSALNMIKNSQFMDVKLIDPIPVIKHEISFRSTLQLEPPIGSLNGGRCHRCPLAHSCRGGVCEMDLAAGLFR
jgi:hypothetical protein